MKKLKFSELAHFTDLQRKATKVADAHRFTLFGGARGPGKSYWLRWSLIRLLLQWTQQGFHNVRVMLACEDFPALRERQISKITVEFPEWLGHWWSGVWEYRLGPKFGSGVICCRNLDDASKYQSAEFAAIAVDELTKNTQRTFDQLRGSLRWPGINRTRFLGATNPTGQGAGWVRGLWVEQQFPENMGPLAHEFAFVPGLATDNPYLEQSYHTELSTLPTTLRKAWRDGDWYAAIEGLVYPEFTAENLTDDEPDPDLPVELAGDDGYVDPRALYLIQKSGTRILIFDELYQRQRLAETSVNDLVERCEENGWPLPEIAVVGPESKELQARLRMANIPVRYRSHKIVQGIAVVRRLICDGQGYRAIQVHRRCKNLIWEWTEGHQYPEGARGDHEKPMDGNDHAADAIRHWCWVRARRPGMIGQTT